MIHSAPSQYLSLNPRPAGFSIARTRERVVSPHASIWSANRATYSPVIEIAQVGGLSTGTAYQSDGQSFPVAHQTRGFLLRVHDERRNPSVATATTATVICASR